MKKICGVFVLLFCILCSEHVCYADIFKDIDANDYPKIKSYIKQHGVNEYILIDDHILMSPFFYAVEHGRLETVKLFVEAGADVNQLKKGADGPCYPVNLATQEGYAKTAKYLVDHGARCVGYGWSALLTAVDVKNAELIDYFLAKGVDPNLPEGDVYPLVAVAKQGNFDLFLKLISFGAKLNINSDYSAALKEGAVSGKNKRIIKFITNNSIGF